MWLDSNDIRYEMEATYTGRSGQSQTFSFLLSKMNGTPPQLLQAVQYPSLDTINRLTFAWGDVVDSRPPEACLYAILNDERGKPKSQVFNTLSAYDIGTLMWSERDTYAHKIFTPSLHSSLVAGNGGVMSGQTTGHQDILPFQDDSKSYT
ncbi:MAG: DUF1829 domain-containing protein [Chloroflexaceae bacterium]|nr:DUF1829 domain-containing protein [Chloroflexaceae bacterium]